VTSELPGFSAQCRARLGPENRCGSVASTLYLFHNQREVGGLFGDPEFA
jgi:hypothetical protein